jgi:hypothetical protein
VYDDETLERIDSASELFNLANSPFSTGWYFEGILMEKKGAVSIHFIVTNSLKIAESNPNGDFFEETDHDDMVAYFASFQDDDFTPITNSEGFDESVRMLIDIDTGTWSYEELIGTLPDSLKSFLDEELAVRRKRFNN